MFGKVAVWVVAIMLAASVAIADSPKYIFFFLGDGMSSSQIQAAEAYLTTINGGDANRAADLLEEENRLNLSKLPVLGMQTTYDAYALMTDSASSATAFACGAKTQSGVIGMDAAKTKSYKSVAQLAKEQGKRVGVISSVSLDHATPAAYYASIPSRGNMNDIGAQMAQSGYDFFGGGGLAKPLGTYDVWTMLSENGYTVLNDRDAILALKQSPRDKVVCINPWLQDSAAMPYAIDRPDTNLSLAEMTEVAISVLHAKEDKPGKDKPQNRQNQRRGGDDGFFLMVEGGKIDWACHANDAMATIGDVLDFDEAIGKALDFYRRYPHQTLIVVTGDHETGGMTIGHATTGYQAHYDELLGQTCSFNYFEANQWKTHKAAGVFDMEIMKPLMREAFGLDYAALNTYQQAKLDNAYSDAFNGYDTSNPEKKLLYGGYNPMIVTITHILNEIASVGWTSYSHTGVPVPLFAIGREAQRFSGFYDNTDIAKRLARAMNIQQTLPVLK
jgi:alkaline phosphatase